MKIVRTERLIDKGNFSTSPAWITARDSAIKAIAAADWPPGSGRFTIYPESGKRTGEGNGVKPIKDNTVRMLTGGKAKYTQLMKQRVQERLVAPIIDEWVAEYPWPVGERDKDGAPRPGGMDAAYISEIGLICFEWETGNISSSHRSINKICLGLLKRAIKAGILVVPSARSIHI